MPEHEGFQVSENSSMGLIVLILPPNAVVQNGWAPVVQRPFDACPPKFAIPFKIEN